MPSDRNWLREFLHTWSKRLRSILFRTKKKIVDENRTNNGTLAYAPAVIVMATGLLGLLFMCLIRSCVNLNNFFLEEFFRNPATQTFLAISIVGLALAGEYLAIWILYRDPDDRSRALWDLLTPTVMMAVAGSVIFIGITINTSIDTRTEELSQGFDDVSKRVETKMVSIREALNSIDEEVDKSTTKISSELENLEIELRGLGPFSDVAKAVSVLTNALNDQSSENVEQLTRVVESINGLSSLAVSTPLPISVDQGELMPIVDEFRMTLEDTLKLSVQEPLQVSVQEIEGHKAEVVKLRKEYIKEKSLRKDLRSRNVFKKIKHFFWGID